MYSSRGNNPYGQQQSYSSQSPYVAQNLGASAILGGWPQESEFGGLRAHGFVHGHPSAAEAAAVAPQPHYGEQYNLDFTRNHQGYRQPSPTVRPPPSSWDLPPLLDHHHAPSTNDYHSPPQYVPPQPPPYVPPLPDHGYNIQASEYSPPPPPQQQTSMFAAPPPRYHQPPPWTSGLRDPPPATPYSWEDVITMMQRLEARLDASEHRWAVPPPPPRFAPNAPSVRSSWDLPTATFGFDHAQYPPHPPPPYTDAAHHEGSTATFSRSFFELPSETLQAGAEVVAPTAFGLSQPGKDRETTTKTDEIEGEKDPFAANDYGHGGVADDAKVPQLLPINFDASKDNVDGGTQEETLGSATIETPNLEKKALNDFKKIGLSGEEDEVAGDLYTPFMPPEKSPISSLVYPSYFYVASIVETTSRASVHVPSLPPHHVLYNLSFVVSYKGEDKQFAAEEIFFMVLMKMKNVLIFDPGGDTSPRVSRCFTSPRCAWIVATWYPP